MNLPEGDWLPARDGHRVWWCEGGDPRGLPVLLVHGGPGGASRVEPARWFDGLPLRWIAIDQRGCGRSLPLGETAANDLDALLADMEALRERLALPRWALVAGSWGVRVALAYAARCPRRVHGLFMRSPFLGTSAETQRYIAAWSDWLGAAGRDWLGAAAVASVTRLFGGATTPVLPHDTACPASELDIGRDARIALAWSAYDDAQSQPGGVAASGARCDPASLGAASAAQQASWQIHAHYALAGWGGAAPIGAAPSGPLALVWGAADAACDPASARRLAAAWAHAAALEVAGGGHRMSDARMAPALRAAARSWAHAL